jgi:hypothetical protein
VGKLPSPRPRAFQQGFGQKTVKKGEKMQVFLSFLQVFVLFCEDRDMHF